MGLSCKRFHLLVFRIPRFLRIITNFVCLICKTTKPINSKLLIWLISCLLPVCEQNFVWRANVSVRNRNIFQGAGMRDWRTETGLMMQGGGCVNSQMDVCSPKWQNALGMLSTGDFIWIIGRISISFRPVNCFRSMLCWAMQTGCFRRDSGKGQPSL